MHHLLFTAAVPFEAARRLESLAFAARLRRLHGHSFLAQVRTALPAGWAGFPGGEVDALRARLAAAVAPLDYRDLSAVVTDPTDANLARWLAERCEVPAGAVFGIRSAADRGVEWAGGAVEFWCRYRFESAHRLPRVPAGHKCGRMHGHGFEVVLRVRGVGQDATAAEAGVHDLLDAAWAPLHAALHHTCLNDLPGLEIPTSEMLSSWLWQRLVPDLPGLAGVTVYETAHCGATFDGRDYRIWRETTLDSAVRLQWAPAGDARRRIHGHTFTLRLHLDAPLDEVMGWTMDFGDVKEKFGPAFREMDHQPLHELAGADFQPDAASLARWIAARIAGDLPEVSRIDLEETPGCGVVLAV